jgi:hypothetical protein
MTREEWLRQEIDGFRKKIQLYESFIVEYEQQLGLTPGGPIPAGRNSASAVPKATGDGDPLSKISGMIFFNKSQPEAAKAYLEMAGYPLTTPQIMAGIEKGGVKVGGKTEKAKKQNLYTILNRSPEFGRVKRDTWGLAGWPGVAKKSQNGDEDDDLDSASGKEPGSSE